MPTLCPECGGAKNVHVARYDRWQIPTHERGSSPSAECDSWIRKQALTAANQTGCRVCYGKGHV